MTSIFEKSLGPNGQGNGGNGWKTAALGALGTCTFALVGWVATDAATARAKMADELNDTRQRVAVLEEQARTEREALKRIEDGVDELRRAQVEHRR
jgi:hypothetical protein